MMPVPSKDDDNFNNSISNGMTPTPEEDNGLVCKPSDGRRRISFATADEYSLEMPRHGIKGGFNELALTEIDEDLSIPVGKKKKSSTSKIRRPSEDDILAEYLSAESELDQVYGEVIMASERKKSMIEVSLSPQPTFSSHIGELPLEPRRHPFWENCQNMLFVIAMAVFLVSFLYGCVGLNQSNASVGIDTSIQPGELVGPIYSVETDSDIKVPKETNGAQIVKVSTATVAPVATIAPTPGGPGDDIAQLQIGSVKQPIQADDLQKLLDHDMLNGIRVVDEDGILNLEAEKTVTVGGVDIMCGIMIDNVSLVLICLDSSCDVYFVGARYCDAYATGST